MDENAARADLQRLNEEIGYAEEVGNWSFFRKCLARMPIEGGGYGSVLAFRRATGVCVDADVFLAGIDDGKPRSTRVDRIEFVGQHRAIVRCTVTSGGQHYDNLRLFVHSEGDGWRLLAWANEPRE